MFVKVCLWFDYMWTECQSVADDQVLDVLPETLRAEIANDVHLAALKKVSLFENCEPVCTLLIYIINILFVDKLNNKFTKH